MSDGPLESMGPLEPMAAEPSALATRLVEHLRPEFDPYDPKLTMQYPGGGLSSVRGPTAPKAEEQKP